MRVPNLRSVGLLAVGAFAATSFFSYGCSTLDRLESTVGAVNILLNAQSPFSTGSAGNATFHGLDVIANLMSVGGSATNPSASPVPNATVSLTVGPAGTAITMNSTSPGTYNAISGSGGTPTFTYSSNQTYTVTMTIPSGNLSGTYTTQVVAPPATQVSGLPDPLQGEVQPVGQPLTLTITSGSYDFGLVLVVDSTGTLTYSNQPQTPQDWLNFVLGGFSGTITIPGTAFPAPGATYGVAVAGLKSGPESGISSNLEILSRFMAGSAKTSVLITGTDGSASTAGASLRAR
jgi:hypothetical protein